MGNHSLFKCSYADFKTEITLPIINGSTLKTVLDKQLL